MKLARKLIIMTIAIGFIVFLCQGKVDAATVNVRASKNQVTVEDTVSVTVSISEKVAGGQFKLNYDSNKFKFVSKSSGSFNESTKIWADADLTGASSISSVVFTFKATAVGSGNFSLSGVVFPVQTTVGSSASVTVIAKQQQKPAETSNQSNSSNKQTPSKNTNKNNSSQNTTKKEETVEQVDKSDLESLKKQLEGKVQSDYTEESWKALQDIISRAENATTNSDYNQAKSEFSVDKLAPAEFEKNELYNLLLEIVSKKSENYTEESWNELQNIIMQARDAKLKSEYEQVKDKLNINVLKEKLEKKSVIEGNKIILILLVILIALLLAIVITLAIKYKKAKDEYVEEIKKRTKYRAKKLKN